MSHEPTALVNPDEMIAMFSRLRSLKLTDLWICFASVLWPFMKQQTKLIELELQHGREHEEEELWSDDFNFRHSGESNEDLRLALAHRCIDQLRPFVDPEQEQHVEFLGVEYVQKKIDMCETVNTNVLKSNR